MRVLGYWEKGVNVGGKKIQKVALKMSVKEKNGKLKGAKQTARVLTSQRDELISLSLWGRGKNELNIGNAAMRASQGEKGDRGGKEIQTEKERAGARWRGPIFRILPLLKVEEGVKESFL